MFITCLVFASYSRIVSVWPVTFSLRNIKTVILTELQYMHFQGNELYMFLSVFDINLTLNTLNIHANYKS